jgi:hypothetical protein
MVMAQTNKAEPWADTGNDGRPDPLGYWLMQERAGLEDVPTVMESEPDRGAVSGWWILPVLLLSLLAWVWIARLVW